MFYNDIIDTAKLSKQFKRAKVIALLKPGKDGQEAIIRSCFFHGWCYLILKILLNI